VAPQNGAAEPLVVVAFSSTFQNQLGAIRNAARAMADLPVRGVVTLGPALAGCRIDAPPNVTVVDAASHDVLMAQASVVVTHGGHGTVIRALTHGVPLLCLPMGRDQHDNAARTAARGAGLTLDRAASVGAIREALSHLLEDGSFRAAARRLSVDIAETNTSDLVAEAEALAWHACRDMPRPHRPNLEHSDDNAAAPLSPARRRLPRDRHVNGSYHGRPASDSAPPTPVPEQLAATAAQFGIHIPA
jgi:hypothetical protein